MVLFLAMFAVLGWFDFKTRETYELIFVVFGGAGAVLYVFDWQDMTGTTLIIMACAACAMSLLWRLGLFGTGDLLAVFAGLVIYPVYGDSLMPNAVAVFIGGWALSLVFGVSWNAALNVSDVVKRGGIFKEVTDRRARKCAAFFLVHRQRRFERNTFLAEEITGSGRRLKLGLKSPNREFAKAGTAKYVEYTCPLMLFSAVAAFVLLTGRLLLH